jgi:Fic family protein
MFMLDAIEETALDTIKKVNIIHQLLQNTIEEVKKKLPDIYTKELVELLFNQPYSKIQLLVEHKIAKRQTAAVYLDQLTKIGILKKSRVGKEALFLNRKLFDVFSKKV